MNYYKIYTPSLHPDGSRSSRCATQGEIFHPPSQKLTQEKNSSSGASSLSSLPPCPEMLPLSLVTQNSWAQQNLNAVLSFPPRLAALLSWTWNGKCLLWFSWFENVCCQSQDRNSLHEKQKLRESILIYNRCPVQCNHVILSLVLNRWPNTSCWGRLELGGGCRFDPIVLFVVNVRFFFCGLPLENISQPAVTEGSSAYSTLTRAWHKCVSWKRAFRLQCSCASWGGY